MKSSFKLLTIFLIIPLLIGIAFFENIKGYYRFTNYCEKEAGLKIYRKIDSNHGWLVESLNVAMEVSYFKGVKFSRYKDRESNEFVDVKYIDGKPDNRNSFQITPASLGETTKYRWINFSEYVVGEVRLGRYGNEVLDSEGNKMIGLYNFSYEKFSRNYMPLDMNPIVICPESRISQKANFNTRIDSINSSFKN